MADNDDLIRRVAVAFWGSEAKRNAVDLAKQAIDVIEPLLREQIAKETKEEAAEPTVPPVKVSGARQFKTGPKPEPDAISPFVTAEEVEGMIVTALLGQQAEFTAVAREATLQRSVILMELRAKVEAMWEEQWRIVSHRSGGDNPVADTARGAAEALREVLEWIDADVNADGSLERNRR